jgi:hypothetical protein
MMRNVWKKSSKDSTWTMKPPIKFERFSGSRLAELSSVGTRFLTAWSSGRRKFVAPKTGKNLKLAR